MKFQHRVLIVFIIVLLPVPAIGQIQTPLPPGSCPFIDQKTLANLRQSAVLHLHNLNYSENDIVEFEKKIGKKKCKNYKLSKLYNNILKMSNPRTIKPVGRQD